MICNIEEEKYNEILIDILSHSLLELFILLTLKYSLVFKIIYRYDENNIWLLKEKTISFIFDPEIMYHIEMVSNHLRKYFNETFCFQKMENIHIACIFFYNLDGNLFYDNLFFSGFLSFIIILPILSFACDFRVHTMIMCINRANKRHDNELYSFDNFV